MRRSTFLSALGAGLMAGLLGLAAPAAAQAANSDELIGGWYALSWTQSPTLYQVAEDGTLTAIGSASQSMGVAGFDVDATNGRALFPTYSGAGELWEIDLATGEFAKVGDSNFTGATAFDIGNNGELWIAADSLDGSAGFGKLDPDTGQVSRLADGPERIAALATAPNGVLYAFGYSNKAYTYSPDSNEFTHVADLGVSILAADFDTDGTVLLQSWDGTLTRYDISTGTTTGLFRMSDSVSGFQGEAFSVAGPTDGRTIDEVLNPPTDPAVSLSSAEAAAGGQVTVTGSGFTPDGSARIELDDASVSLGTVTADGTGAFTFTATIPANTAAGAHSIVAVDETSGRSSSSALTVVAATTSTPAAPELSLTLDLLTGAEVAGADAKVSATGLQPGAQWSVTVRSTPQVIASGTVAGDGTLTTSAALPAGLEAGWHSLTLDSTFSNGQPAVARLWFRVASDGTLAEVSYTEPILAATGADGPLAAGLLGAALLLMGGAAFGLRSHFARRAA